ncbi:exonuclease domain-containing protein [Salinibacterium sp.]|uniref:exonuclease domain-containing protein n=2 Tax=Salinibacterium sp. TaxID=1915057 RepID=UPI00286D30FB|nr:exonuclease domain-containing protein [Salinibacterium sp.]
MNNWGQLGVFDLETTGVDVDTARIVSACIAILNPDGSIVARWDWLADPGIEIPAAASAVHGITTERARALGRNSQVVDAEITQSLRVQYALGNPLVEYNAPYDLSLLDRECRRHGLEPLRPPTPVIDPLVLDKVVDKFRKGKRTLEVTASHYDVALDDAHDAGSDAIAAGRVAQALAAAYPDQLDVPLADLHERQVTWYAEQAASFADYIRRVKGDQDFVADSEWPVRTSEHPGSILDTQPIEAPLPRPSLRVPHLDFDTGVLVLDRPALEAPAIPVAAMRSLVELEAVTVESVQDDHAQAPTDAGVADDNQDAHEEAVAHEEPAADDEPGADDEPAGDDETEHTPESGAGDVEYEPLTLVPSAPVESAPFEFALLEFAPLDPEEDQGALWSGVDPDDSLPGPEESVQQRSGLAVFDTPDAQGDDPQAAIPERPALRPTVLRVAAAIITDADGRTLLVRKRGSTSFMQAGGKIERGESAVDALSRELLEEIGLELDTGVTEYLGSFRAEAANEPDTVIRAEVFALTTSLELAASGEIEELLWIDTDEPEGVEMAPLTRDTILPLWIARRTARS